MEYFKLIAKKIPRCKKSAIQSLIKQSALDYGCWLSPAGKKIEVKFMGHEDAAIKLGYNNHLDIMNNGYIRIVFTTHVMGIDKVIGIPLTQKQAVEIVNIYKEQIDTFSNLIDIRAGIVQKDKYIINTNIVTYKISDIIHFLKSDGAIAVKSAHNVNYVNKQYI